jgi:hypothetical protein
MNKFLFLIIPNNNGSTILYKYLTALSNFVPLLNQKNEPDEGEKILFRKYKTIEESPMPVPAYYEPHNPHIQLHQQNGNPIIPGLGRMWGAVNYKDIFGNKEIFNWDLIKKEWLDTWKSNKKYNNDSILVEKSPTNPVWASMLEEEYDNPYFVMSIRDPYAVCAGIKRRVKISQNHELDIKTCILHWIETAKLQLNNIKNIKNSIWFTYEDLCEDPDKILEKFKTLIPSHAEELDTLFDNVIEGKDYGGKFENRNEKAISELSANDIRIINSFLEKEKELLDFFNYKILNTLKTVKPMKKTYSGFELSVIQNFICTKPERLDMIKENLPKFAKAINPYPVIVNYDTDIYAKEIYDLYNKYIDNLHFRQNFDLEWGTVTKDLIECTDSPYLMYLCEDIIFDPNLTHEKVNEVLNEYKHYGCKHMLMGKVDKYSQERWHEKSKKAEHLWIFPSEDCPYFNLSSDALFEREFFKKIVNESIGKGKGLSGLMYGIEQSGIRHRDIMCSVPIEIIVNEEHPGPGENISERFTSPTL